MVDTLCFATMQDARSRRHPHYDALQSLYNQYTEANEDAKADGTCPISEPAVKRACELLCAATSLITVLPASLSAPGVLYGDGEGNLRADWAVGDRHLTLFIHASDPARDYLYHQEGTAYGGEFSLTPEMLANWLRWLTGQIK